MVFGDALETMVTEVFLSFFPFHGLVFISMKCSWKKNSEGLATWSSSREHGIGVQTFTNNSVTLETIFPNFLPGLDSASIGGSICFIVCKLET